MIQQFDNGDIVEITQPDEYYIQHRGFLGNALMWLAEDCAGYTANIKYAGKYSKEYAFFQIKLRPNEDMAWSCEYIDNDEKSRVTIIDYQYLDYSKQIK